MCIETQRSSYLLQVGARPGLPVHINGLGFLQTLTHFRCVTSEVYKESSGHGQDHSRHNTLMEAHYTLTPVCRSRSLSSQQVNRITSVSLSHDHHITFRDGTVDVIVGNVTVHKLIYLDTCIWSAPYVDTKTYAFCIDILEKK